MVSLHLHQNHGDSGIRAPPPRRTLGRRTVSESHAHPMHYYVWELADERSQVDEEELQELHDYDGIQETNHASSVDAYIDETARGTARNGRPLSGSLTLPIAPPPRSISSESTRPLLQETPLCEDIVTIVVEGARSNGVADSTPQLHSYKKNSDNGDSDAPASNASTPSEYHDQWILAPLAVTILKMKLKKKFPVPHEKQETRMQFFLETLIPFIFAGTGLVFAGLLIAKSKEWQFFKETSGALMLVPVLFGLKGNLEMTLASRLSTLANLGFMDTYSQKKQVFISNIALIQVQAIVVSSLAVFISVLTMWFDPQQSQFVTFPRVVHLFLSGVSTASVASYVLGTLMFSVVCLARKYKINPDNITTPVAASLGDASTLLFMLGLGTAFLQIRDSAPVVLLAILMLFYLSAVAGTYIAYKDQFTIEVLKNGWWAVLTAMMISMAAGFGFEKAMDVFEIGTYQPVINGVGGNLVAVQSSRISTNLHWRRKNKLEETGRLYKYCNPFHAFLGSHEDSVAARILVAMAMPGLLAFYGVLCLGSYLLGLAVHFTVPFLIGYLLVGLIQVLILLFVCQWLVRTMWQYRIDPDNSAIPVLTALGDLLGQVLLAGCFLVQVNVFGSTEFYSTDRQQTVVSHPEKTF